MTETHEELQHLLEGIYRERGFDFREYRETTLARRLSRRLRARGVRTYAAYGRVLDEDPAEYDKLFDDLTINVSSFFRDDVAFRALEEQVVPALTNNGTKTIRVWSAGCATGEEPYSLAMIFQEALGRELHLWDLQILATDIDAKTLDRAREATFGPKDVETIRPELLNRYFVPVNGSFLVNTSLRESVTFERHDLVTGQPYRDMDLVVCRNVIIYFTPVLQARVLNSFYEGLREGGFLMLGKAEVPTREAKPLFPCLDDKAKIYQKAPQATREPLDVPRRPHTPPGVVVMAASAGAIQVLEEILSRLPANLPAPILVVQHLSPERETHLHEYLAVHSSLPVRQASDGMCLEAGVAYIAVPGYHFRIENGCATLDREEPVNYVRPSADVLFASAVKAYGAAVLGIILSGTGRDGAGGCREIKAEGGITIAQSESTSRYFGMPKAAIDGGAIDYVLSPPEIAEKIVDLLTKQEQGEKP